MLGSVTRIADLTVPLEDLEARSTDDWSFGDVVVAEVTRAPLTRPDAFELRDGRATAPMKGDLLVGALARRFATLEATGSFEAVDDDGIMHLLSRAGCFGALTSRSRFSPQLHELRYRGHVIRGGRPVRLREHRREGTGKAFDLPVVLIVGTSMSAGKTHAGRVAVRALTRLGHRVVGAKLTGAGRRGDSLAFGDAGAEWVFDFMDAGLPTTVCPPEEYRSAISELLSHIASAAPDATAAVIEAGASPLEPYNGATLVDLLDERIGLTILCASDPYAVEGIRNAWGRTFDLVAGPTANTAAGVHLVRVLCGLPAIDLMEERGHEELERMLRTAIPGPGTR